MNSTNGTKQSARLGALLVTVTAALGACASDSPSIDRGFDQRTQIFYSNDLPSLTMSIPESFEYAGRYEFPLSGKAWVDRHVFIESQKDTVRKLIILQFEGLLDSVKGQYSFGLPNPNNLAGSNYRYSSKTVKLGSRDWFHNTWAFDHEASAKENPNSESARLLDFLSARRLYLEAGLIMSRYVRAVGDKQRNELILFYMEPLSTHGFSLDDFPDGGPPNDTYDNLSALIVKHSDRIFKTLKD